MVSKARRGSEGFESEYYSGRYGEFDSEEFESDEGELNSDGVGGLGGEMLFVVGVGMDFVCCCWIASGVGRIYGWW